MRIPPEKFEEIAQANDIVDVISTYTQIKRRGKSFLALCPFHPDKNPSMNVSQQKQVYHCFACGASGNVYTFVQEYEKISFIEAAEKLAMRAGIELRVKSSSPDYSNEISLLYEINKAAAKYYNHKLNNLSGYEKDFVWDYIKSREIKKETITKFGIGYAEKEWDSLLNHFIEEDIFSKEDLEKAGLIKQSDTDKDRYYDRFRGRLIFPVFAENDKVVGFGARKLFDDDPGGNYINSPETRVYLKSKILYGLNFSREFIRAHDYVILVEGYFDLVSLFQADIKNVVASSGTALTPDQVHLLSRYTKNVVVIYDADLAGVKAARRSIELILEAGLDLTVVTLPEGEDPDSLVRTKGKEGFELYLNNRKSIIEFISSLYEKENKLDSVNDRTEFVKEIIGYLSRIPDKIKRAFYIKDLSQKYNLYESDLRDEVTNTVKKNYKDSFPKSSVVIPPKKNVVKTKRESEVSSEELELLDILVNGNFEAIEYLEKNIDFEYLTNKTVCELTGLLLDEFMTEGKIDAYKVLDKTEDAYAKELIGQLTNPKHEISQSEMIPRHSLLSKADKKSQDYIRIAKDVIKRFKIMYLEKEIDKNVKEGANLNEILKLKREIDGMRKSGG